MSRLVAWAATSAMMIMMSARLPAEADPPAARPGGELLDELVGQWELSGSMGEQALAQNVAAEWVLNRQFLRVTFRDRDPPKGKAVAYEATAFIGREPNSGRYVMHLLDVFGPEYSKTLGVGTRDGAAIVFRFDYPGKPFRARHAWNGAERVWDIKITYQDRAGEWKGFAEKHLKRPTGTRK